MNYRNISQIAQEIRRDWGSKINYAAKPYLDAMTYLKTMDDRYGVDSASNIIAYFLSNAAQWKGDTARRIKSELNAMLKGKPYSNPVKESTNNLKKLIELIVDRKLNKSVAEGKKITMNNLDWGKSTTERNANLDKYNSLKTDKEKDAFLQKLKTIIESIVDRKLKSMKLTEDYSQDRLVELEITFNSKMDLLKVKEYLDKNTAIAAAIRDILTLTVETFGEADTDKIQKIIEKVCLKLNIRGFHFETSFNDDYDEDDETW